MQNFQGATRFSRDMTDADLSTHLQSVTARGGIHVNFKYVKVRGKSRDAALNGTIQTRLIIEKQPKGDRSTVATRFISEDRAQREFPREYAMFKQYEEVPTSGTPLEELPGISRSQIGLLVLNGLRSIEDLLEISEDQVGQLGLDAIKAQKTAKAWADRREGASEEINAADIQARFEMQVKSMNAQMEKMAEANRMLESQVTALSARQGQGNNGATAPVADGTSGAMAVEGSEDLAYDVSEMPDPWSEGPATTDGADDLGMNDPDPLG